MIRMEPMVVELILKVLDLFVKRCTEEIRRNRCLEGCTG